MVAGYLEVTKADLARIGLDAGACHGTIKLKSKLNPHTMGDPVAALMHSYFASTLLNA